MLGNPTNEDVLREMVVTANFMWATMAPLIHATNDLLMGDVMLKIKYTTNQYCFFDAYPSDLVIELEVTQLKYIPDRGVIESHPYNSRLA